VSGFRNTLYVTVQGAYLAKDHENVQVRLEKEVRLSVPLHHLAGIVCFGRVSMSPDIVGECAERAIEVSLLTQNGRFLGRIEGTGQGASVLRRAQYRAAESTTMTLALARSVVVGKVANARSTLQRAARESEDPGVAERISNAATKLGNRRDGAIKAATVDEVRGHEGEAAAGYFAVFDDLIRKQRETFAFAGRNRRPPKDPMNALLSFLYALLLHDASSALQSVGLDPAVGFLHAERPGRPSLALDLMEEFRSFLADRTAVALVNLGQVKSSGFRKTETGAVEMDDATRKEVIGAYQRRKLEGIRHEFLSEETTVGLLMHVQARLLARTIRGDIDAYPPFHAR